MAWADGGTRGTAQEKVSDTSIAASPTSAIEVDTIAVVWVACDNPSGLADGPTTVLSVSDTDGHTWTRLKEHTNNGAAAAGVTAGIFATKLTSEIAATDVITATVSSAVTAKVVGFHKFTVAAGKTFAVANAVGANADGSSAFTVTSGTISSAERLWLGLAGIEGNATRFPAAGDADYTLACDADGIIATSGGGEATNISMMAEFRIATLTADTYNMTLGGALDWAAIIVALDEVAEGGTTFTVDLAGTVTPTGALAKQTNKAVAGQVSPSGALTKQVSKLLAGAISPSGLLANVAQKALSGTITPAGALSNVKVAVLSVAGQITPAGALALLTSKIVGGTLTPSGALTKEVRKPLGGAITPAGALAQVRVAVLSVAGAITPTGMLSRLVQKALAGTTTPAGALTKRTDKTFAGSVAPAGIVSNVKTAFVSLAGQITPTGALGPWLVRKALAGSSTPAGILSRLVSKALSGSVAPTGTGLFELISSTARNLLLTLGRLRAKWVTGAPSLKWVMGRPRRKWTSGEPEA